MHARQRRPRNENDTRIVMGWSEYVSFPDWDVVGVRAKVDTGAKTSALHVENLARNGRSRVHFDTLSGHAGRRRRVRVEAAIARTGRVRSSSGHDTIRFFTRARVVMGPIERTIELSLVDRTHMIFRMLLGRTALHGLLVDPTRSRLFGSL